MTATTSSRSICPKNQITTLSNQEKIMSTDQLPAVPESASEELALAKTTTHKDTSPMACLLDTELFNHLWRVATAYSRSSMVPDHFRGKADDCFVAAQLALRLEVDLFMLMQNMYVVHGKPGMEAKLAIAMCNSRGPFRERIQWKFDGEGKQRSCTAFAHDKQTGNLCEQTVTWGMVEAEGWNKDSKGVRSKWNTIPDLMFQYRSAVWLIRTNCPEVLMGMHTTDELADIIVDARSSDAGKSFRKALPSTTVEKMLESAEPPQEKPSPTSPAPQPEPAAESQSQSDDEDENTEVARYIDELRDIDKPEDLTKARETTPKSWTADHRQKYVSAIEMREAEVLGGQTGKSKKGELFDD